MFQKHPGCVYLGLLMSSLETDWNNLAKVFTIFINQCSDSHRWRKLDRERLY